MKHSLKISVSKQPQTGGIVSCRNVTVRERFMKLLFGDKRRITVLIPGDSVGEISICEPDTSQLLAKVVSNLETLTDSIKELQLAMADGQVASAEPEKPKITLEQVRGILAEKSRAGFTAEVRSIIESFGANRLSEIDANDYEAVLAKAEVLGDG